MPRPIPLLAALLLALTAVACQAPQTPEPAASGAPRPLSVGFLIVDGVYNTELTAPYDIFHHSVFHTQPGMRVFTVGPDRDPVTTFEGLRLLPDHGFDDAPPIDVLVVPSAEHNMDSDLEDEALIGFVRERGTRAQLVLSLCDGAFVLAQAGLLDGLQCTTFPSDIEAFRARFPQLDVAEGVSFVHDGTAVTSAGGALSFDAALYVAERLYGVQAAEGMALGLCIDWALADIDHIRVEGARP